MRAEHTETMMTVAVSCSSLAASRAEAAETLQELGVAPERMHEVLLVVSELITNACEHGDGPVTMSIGAEGAFVTASVTNAAPPDAIPAPTAWRLPRPLAPSGRGLGIVASLVDRADVDSAAGTVTVRVWMHCDLA